MPATTIRRAAALATLLLALAFCLPACGSGERQGVELDLTIAREAYAAGYFLEAETAYERYLQADPQGKYRLEAWTRLVEIASGVKGDTAKAVTLLETATLEYNARPEANYPLLFRLAELYELQGQRKKAVEAWGRAHDASGSDTGRAIQAQMRTAMANRALGRHDLAVDLLQQCASQAKDPETRSRALFELAQTHGLAWQWAKAKPILESILAMDKAPADTKTMSAFLLADAYEAEHNLPKAREILTSLKDTYPNPEVIVSRLESLGKTHPSTTTARLQPGDELPEEVAPKSGRIRARGQ